MGSKFHFCQLTSIDKYLKFKKIEHFIHYIKLEMWPALFYVNFLYFHHSNSIHPEIQNWDFWMRPLGCTPNFFLIHKKIENLDLLILLQLDLSISSQYFQKRWNIRISES